MSNYIHESEDLIEFFHGDIIIDLEEEKIDGKIYKITNLINNKIYIGQTKHKISRRFYLHCYDAKNKKRKFYLHSAINKYGKDNFKIEQIDSATTLKELNQKECEWIVKENCLAPNGYNLRAGGMQMGISEKTRKKMSEAQLKLHESGMIKSPWSDKEIHQKSMETRELNRSNVFITNNPMHNDESKKKKLEKTSGDNHYLRKTRKYFMKLKEEDKWQEIFVENNIMQTLKELNFCSGTFFHMLNDEKYSPSRGELSKYDIKRVIYNED